MLMNTMLKQRERVVKGDVSSDHTVQLFDEPGSLAESVSAFLFEGWTDGQSLLIAARAEEWEQTSRQLAALGCPVSAAIVSGRLVVLDAEKTMDGFMDCGAPNASAFNATVGALVSRLTTENPQGLRIFGTMVDVLATRGEYDAAEQLEALWNDLGARCSFSLLCGYSSANFADTRTAGRLHAICGAHTHASAKPGDLLGAWLLAGRQSGFQFSRA